MPRGGVPREGGKTPRPHTGAFPHTPGNHQGRQSSLAAKKLAGKHESSVVVPKNRDVGTPELLCASFPRYNAFVPPRRCRFGGRGSQLTPGVEGTVEQGQEAGLPEGVAAIHQLVAAALETALEAHLPAGHPVLCGMDRSRSHCEDRDPPTTAPPTG